MKGKTGLPAWGIVIAASIGIIWGVELIGNGEAVAGLVVVFGSAWFANSLT